MVQDNNEHKKPQEGSDNLSPAEREKLKSDLQKEHDEAVNLSKKAKAEILHELEKKDNTNQRQLAQDLMRQSDFPKMNSEQSESPDARIREIFEEIRTDHVKYDFFRGLFPNFIHLCESTPIGKSFPRDLTGLLFGIADSIGSVVKLGGHFTLDILKVIWSPRKSYQQTREFW